MARIGGTDLPRNKRGVIGLTYIYGIGRTSARQVLAAAGVSEDTKVSEWNDENIKTISRIISEDYKIEGELRSEVQLAIKRLMDIACYRGLRHRKGLPLRGQRTRTNARTRKGRRKTVAGKKKVGR
jgi:small subunit ribosomal protein S13